MTQNQAIDFKAKYPSAIDLTKPSHFGELSPLVEVHVELVRITRAECVKLYASDGSSFMPNEAAIQRLGMAAGIQFSPNAESTRKDGPACWVGTAQGMQMSPDGKWELGPPSEYEWDADIQVEALRVAGKKGPWNDAEKRYDKKPYSEQELAENRMQFMKTGRQRANTGARSRAVLACLGQKRSFKGLFAEKGTDADVVEFLVSRIIQNTKNEMVLRHSLSNMQGFTAALFGAQKQSAIAAPSDVVAGTFEVEPSTQGGSGFDPDSPEPSLTPYREALKSILKQHGKILGPKAEEIYQAMIDDKSIPEEEFQKQVRKAVNYLGTEGILVEGVNLGGAA